MSETAREPDLAVDPKIWNHHPVVPIRSGDLFRNLLNPFAVTKGKLLSWFGAYVRGVFLVLITALWLGIFPSMEEIAVGPGFWMAEILIINLTTMLCWAGGGCICFSIVMENRGASCNSA
jgi:hypothetical protein